ncbi:uncharacterized protein EDB93DRAFT_1336039 [Suillus bovinus]|uniref:uncharacterized protein n=1 Tax=Suillus bovinus TaxID=48563 RepID=UPI001B85E6DB|nr:uncharacterized protein EDB93DRAFT_1336039 [Suillus bovinus]KAG2154465.1 hypothetical protein EDB93DRAFT_1336039 [Suillus bovinus]
MTVLNINKLSFYVLLLSAAFAQILVVSAQGGIIVEPDGTLEGLSGGLKVGAKKDISAHGLAEGDVEDRRCVGTDSGRSTRGCYFDETMISQGLICRSNFRLQRRSEDLRMCGSIMSVGHTVKMLRKKS